MRGNGPAGGLVTCKVFRQVGVALHRNDPAGPRGAGRARGQPALRARAAQPRPARATPNRARAVGAGGEAEVTENDTAPSAPPACVKLPVIGAGSASGPPKLGVKLPMAKKAMARLVAEFTKG